jgi:hypothetical protein
MRSGLYKSGRTAFATGNIKWRSLGGDNIKCLLVTDAYTVDLRAHSALIDIPMAARLGFNGDTDREKFPKLILISPDDGICDANDVDFGQIPEGNNIVGVIIYKDTPNEKTSTLITFIDLEFTTNGTQVLVGWDKGPNKIFKL